MSELITQRELNRATLARQFLLEREEASALQAVERLVGLQAQEAKPPFVGLWSRLEHFERTDLTTLLQKRQVVRATAMRCTLHLMTADDYRKYRATLQPALTLAMQSVLRARIDGLDIPTVVAKAREFFSQTEGTFEELRAYIAQDDPDCDVRALGYTVRTHLPLIMVPTDTLWGYPAAAKFTLADSWLGSPLSKDENLKAFALRYLAAFGPASPADAQSWSGLKGMKEVFQSLRSELVIFKDEHGRELFDLPDARRPNPETNAPIRFLPEFDNLLLAHADRSRIIADEHRKRVVTPNLRVLATFLVDGFVAGTWKVERKKKTATLLIQPFEPLAKTVQKELTEEGDALMRFLEEDAQQYEIAFG